MTDGLIFTWHAYKYMPYEREFAARELQSLTGVRPQEVREGLSLGDTQLPTATLARLTYFRSIAGSDGLRVIPQQALLESGDDAASDLFSVGPNLKRQKTRYSVHCLHEYRGRFNPQVVRAIGNILNVPENGWVLDPFCGSGTTIAECAHLGWNALGVDLNPLGVAIANAKLAALRTAPGTLSRVAQLLERELAGPKAELSHGSPVSSVDLDRIAGADWRERLPNFPYLEQWFNETVLCQISLILGAIDRLESDDCRAVYKVVLSDIVRDVSFQEPADLRIRRRKDTAPNYPAIDLFLGAAFEKSQTIERGLKLVEPRGSQQAILGDSRQPIAPPGVLGFDAAITSPPYATALPYIDTQRLSLCVLGLLDSSALVGTEKSLIGSREIARSERFREEERLRKNLGGLPDSVASLCTEMLDAAGRPGNGFRRENTPSLIYRYFCDMAQMFSSVRNAIRPNGKYALLVGSNRTSLGGIEFQLNTPQLLAAIAESRGFKVNDQIPLETYQRFDIHHRNSVASEQLIILER